MSVIQPFEENTAVKEDCMYYWYDIGFQHTININDPNYQLFSETWKCSQDLLYLNLLPSRQYSQIQVKI